MKLNYSNKYSRRVWSVKNARFLHEFYKCFISLLRCIKPILPYLPITSVEKTVKEEQLKETSIKIANGLIADQLKNIRKIINC